MIRLKFWQSVEQLSLWGAQQLFRLNKYAERKTNVSIISLLNKHKK